MLLALGATAAAQRAAHHSAQVSGVLATPSSIRAEHQHLHHDLAEALGAGGKTAAAAKKVEAMLMPHFAEEEQYAMPPLSLLQTIAEGREPTEAQAHEAIRMTDELRAHYPRMLAEHKEITAALEQLAAAAKQENKPRQAQFAEALILHAQNEEQILYPAALLLGRYLKLKVGSAHSINHK
jgi:hypothetical protein